MPFSQKLTAFVGGDISEYARKVGVDVPRIAKGASRSLTGIGRVGQRAFRAIGRAAGSAVERLKDFGARWARRGFYALAAGAGLAVREFMKFDTAMREVWSLTDISREKLGKLGLEVRRLAVLFGQDAGGMAKALYQTISAGVEASEAIGLLQQASKAAVAGLTDTFTAVDTLTTIINSYGLSVEDAARISDILFSTIREGKTTFREIAGSIGRVAAIAATAQVPFEELAAALATLTKGGLSTDEAVTALRQTIISIVSPSKEAIETANALGIEFSAAGLKAKGLGGFLREVEEAAAGDIEKLTALFPNVRAFAGVAQLAGTQAAEFAEQLANMADATGATDTAFQKMKGPLFELKQAWSGFKDILIDVGELLTPYLVAALKDIAAWLRDVVDRVRESGDVWQALGVIITEVLSGLIDKVMPAAIDLGVQIAFGIAKGIADNLPRLVWEILKALVKLPFTAGYAIGEGLYQNVFEPMMAAMDRVRAIFTGGSYGRSITEPIPGSSPEGAYPWHDPDYQGPVPESTQSKGSVSLTQNFYYRTDNREAERIAEQTERLAGRGRLGYAY